MKTSLAIATALFGLLSVTASGWAINLLSEGYRFFPELILNKKELEDDATKLREKNETKMKELEAQRAEIQKSISSENKIIGSLSIKKETILVNLKNAQKAAETVQKTMSRTQSKCLIEHTDITYCKNQLRNIKDKQARSKQAKENTKQEEILLENYIQEQKVKHTNRKATATKTSQTLNELERQLRALQNKTDFLRKRYFEAAGENRKKDEIIQKLKVSIHSQQQVLHNFRGAVVEVDSQTKEIKLNLCSMRAQVGENYGLYRNSKPIGILKLTRIGSKISWGVFNKKFSRSGQVPKVGDTVVWVSNQNKK